VFIEAYKLIFELVFKMVKNVPGMEKAIKFIEKDPLFNEDISFLKGIFIVSHETIQKSRLPDLSKKHKKIGAKLIFEPEINERLLIQNISNENMRIFNFNQKIDKEIRSNMIECVNKIFKIEHIDKEILKSTLEEEMTLIINRTALIISEELSLDVFEYYYQPENEIS
jgi:hypothetical protein